MASDEFEKFCKLLVNKLFYVLVISFLLFDLRCSAAVRCVSSSKIVDFNAENYPKNGQPYSANRQGREYTGRYSDRYLNGDYQDSLPVPGSGLGSGADYNGYRNRSSVGDYPNDDDYYDRRQSNYEQPRYRSSRYNNSYSPINRYNTSGYRDRLSPSNRYQDRQYPYAADAYGYSDDKYLEKEPYTSPLGSDSGYDNDYDGYNEDQDEYEDDDDGYEDNRYQNRTSFADNRFQNRTLFSDRRLRNDTYGYRDRDNFQPDAYARSSYQPDNSYGRPRRLGYQAPPDYNTRPRNDPRSYSGNDRSKYDPYEKETCPIQTKETKSSHADIPTTAASGILSTPNGDFILYCARSPAKTVLAYPLYCSGHGEDGMGSEAVSTAIDSSCFDIRVVDDVQNLQMPKHLVVTLSRGAYSAAYQVDYDSGGVRLLPCLHVFEYKYLTDVETVPLGDAGTLLAFANNNIEPGAPYPETYAPIYLVRQGEVAICGFADVQHTTDITSWKRYGNSVVLVYSQRRGSSRRSLLHLFEVRFVNGYCDVRRYKHQRTIGSAPYPGSRNTLCASQPFTVDHCICGVEDVQIIQGPSSRDRAVHLAVALANNHKDENEVGCSDEEKLTPEGDDSKAFCCCPWANQRSFVVAYSSGSRSFEFLNKSPQAFQQLYGGPASVTEISQLQTERCCPVFQTISPVGATELYTLEYTPTGELQVYIFKNHGLPHYAESSSYGYCQENDLIVSYTLHGFQSDNTIYHIRCNKGGLYSSDSYKQRYSKEYFTTRRQQYPVGYTEAPRLVSYSTNGTYNRSSVYNSPQNNYNKTYPANNPTLPQSRLTVSQLESNYTLPYVAPPQPALIPAVPVAVPASSYLSSSGNRSSPYQTQPTFLPSSGYADPYAGQQYVNPLPNPLNLTTAGYHYNVSRPYPVQAPPYSLPITAPAPPYQTPNYQSRSSSYAPASNNPIYAPSQQKTSAYSYPKTLTYPSFDYQTSALSSPINSLVNVDSSNSYIYPTNQFNNTLSSYNRLPYLQGYSNDINPPAPAPLYYPSVHTEMADYAGYNDSLQAYTNNNKSYPSPYLNANYLPASSAYSSPSPPGIHAYDRRSYSPSPSQGIRLGDNYNRRQSYQSQYG